MADTVKTLFRAATSPEDPRIKWRGFAPGRTILPAGSTYSDGGRLLACDIQLDRDVAMKLRDGTRIYLDVYRPVTDQPLPAVLAWSPYGKQGGHQEWDNYPGRAGVARSAVSGLPKSYWEGPDPAFWCANGYTVVNADPRGAFESDGDVQWFSPLEAQDGHDVVEWVAAQDWCADAVTMSGNSWLSVMQWKIAATRPPHLAAIAPWEGFTELYRHLVLVGGIPKLYVAEVITTMHAGRNRAEDLPGMVRKYPFINDYWQSKTTDVEAIDVPAYVVASWTNEVHTEGTLDAWARLDHARSWLRVHNTMEWPDLYEYEQDLLRFYDHVIKGKDNGWDRTPRVRLSVLDPGGQDQVNRPEDDYPLARVIETPLYLQAGSRTLATAPSAEETSASYDAVHDTVVFDYAIDRDVELTGPMSLRLWLETDGYDADVFVYVRKADAQGNPLLATIPPGLPWQGAHGRLRATHRELDPERSTPLRPVPAHLSPAPVQPGEPVRLDIAIWPAGMAWHAGQRLQVVISGHELSVMHPLDALNVSAGTHRIHTGGRYDSHLLVPVATPNGI